MGVRVSDAFLSELLHFTNNVISDVRDVRLSQLCCEISFFGVTATNNAESKEVLVFMLDKCSESNQRKFIMLQIKYLSTCLSEIAEVKKELSLMMKKRKLNTKTPQFESSDEDEERGTRRQCRKEETEEMFGKLSLFLFGNDTQILPRFHPIYILYCQLLHFLHLLFSTLRLEPLI